MCVDQHPLSWQRAKLSAKLFKGSVELLMISAVSDKKLSDEEIRRIRTLLDKRAPGDKQ